MVPRKDPADVDAGEASSGRSSLAIDALIAHSRSDALRTTLSLDRSAIAAGATRDCALGSPGAHNMAWVSNRQRNAQSVMPRSRAMSAGRASKSPATSIRSSKHPGGGPRRPARNQVDDIVGAGRTRRLCSRRLRCRTHLLRKARGLQESLEAEARGFGRALVGASRRS